MEARQKYIDDRMREFAMNIDDFSIDQTVLDQDGAHCVIKNKSLNSIQVFISKKGKEGISCKEWFDMKSFTKRFKAL
jgi:hypothetical protein